VPHFHPTPPEAILSLFVLGCLSLPLIAEFWPRRRERDDDDDEPGKNVHLPA